MILLLILACAWPVSAPAPSQPLIVETVTHETSPTTDDTARGGGSDSSTETRAARPEAATAGVASPEPRPGEPEAKADPGVGGAHD